MAAKNSEYRMAIKIAGEIEKSLYSTTDLTRKELNKIAKEAAWTSSQTKENFARGLSETEPFFHAIEKAGIKTFKAIAAGAATAGTAIAAVGGASAKAGIGFESAFAGVKKTTDATAEEYAQMRQEILAMTREIPAAGTEIAEVAEAAGQLGIQKENLLDFTKTMIDLGESTNLTSVEGASELAKFANITNMSADNYGRLGSVIVDLGNNFATTEADIVQMATRMASSGELAGFTEAQIMAMATAMSSVGIEAEAGGSAMSKMIRKVQVAVETESRSLKDYAVTAGMSVKEFKEAFEKDGLSAVAAFVAGLNDVERNGKSATVILDEMGLTETRLNTTLTSLANADVMMYDAVETANRAWEENTALTEEASKRYETTESRLAIMRHGFTEAGIAVSDQLNGPLRDGIDMITELTHEITGKIQGSTIIHDIAQDIVEGIPTAVRVTGQLAETVGAFAQPFLSVGGWLVEHPKLLTSTITGVGAALMSYKVANGVMSLVSAFKALGPAALPVLGVAGGITAAVGIGTYFAQLDAEMTQANLEEHFGNISLSLEEVNEAARQIVGDRYFDRMDEMMSSAVSSDNLLGSMKDAMKEINATRWELSVGISLSEDDQEEYARNISQYVSSAQNYIKNQGYTVQVATELLLSDSPELNSITADNNLFFKEMTVQAQRMGDEINTIISDSLENGLTIDQEEIDRLLSDMQRITDALSKGEMEAGMQVLEAKYSGKELDSDTVQNLMQDINKYVEESGEGADKALKESLWGLNAQKEMGMLSNKEYEAKKNSLTTGYYDVQVTSAMNAFEFMQRTIEDAYGEEIDPVMESAEKYMQEELSKKMNSDGWASTYSTPEDWKNQTEQIIIGVMGQTDKLGKTADSAGILMEYMEPLRNQIDEFKQQAESAGGKLDNETLKKLNDAEVEMTRMKAAVTGDEESMWKMLGYIAGENEDYAAVLAAAQEQGAAIPQAAIDAMLEKQPEAREAAQGYLNVIKEEMGEGVDVTVPIGITYQSISQFNDSAEIGKRAAGGIITQPEIAWLAEAGYPESVIPLDGSQNAMSLWKKTGELLGVRKKKGLSELMADFTGTESGSTGNTVNSTEEKNRFSYSPTYNFYGGTPDKKELDEHVEESFEKWEEMMNRWVRNNQRFSFS